MMFWTNPGSSNPQKSCCMFYYSSHKQSKLGKQDILRNAADVGIHGLNI